MKQQISGAKVPVKDHIDSNRRKILKKAAYAAPKLVVLGLLTRSPNVLADFRSNSSFSGPDGHPQPKGFPQ